VEEVLILSVHDERFLIGGADFSTKEAYLLMH
jgi:hypothetical protein